MSDFDFLLTAEVAAMLRKPAATLRWWRSKDMGPRSSKHGGTVVYRRTDVEAWIAEQEQATTRGGPS